MVMPQYASEDGSGITPSTFNDVVRSCIFDGLSCATVVITYVSIIASSVNTIASRADDVPLQRLITIS